MTHRDGRKRAIRAHMATTGQTYRQASAELEAAAFAARVDGIPTEEQGVRALAPGAGPADRAHAEAVWRYTDNPGQRCLCSGTGCLHGTPCEPDPEECSGRLVHVDRYPGSMWTLTLWEDIHGCSTCGGQVQSVVDLPTIPWGELGEETSNGGHVTRIYPGTRHPGFPGIDDDPDRTEGPTDADSDWDDDEDCDRCGCWCGGCGCDDAEQDAYEYGDEYSDLATVPAHCCECGRVGVDCEYNCRCPEFEPEATRA